MQLVGEYRFAADRDSVWRALNDPEVLQRAIPGCERIDRITATHWEGRVIVKIWPIKATFDGVITLSELSPPDHYRITIQADAPIVGSTGGSAAVSLVPEGTGTRLTYESTVEIGGRLASFGARLVEGAGTKYADKFFARFAAAMESVTAERAAAARA